MERVKLPEQNVRDYAHELAYRLAREDLAGIADIRRQCLNCDAEYIPSEKAVIVDYLNRAYRISVPDGEVSYVKGTETVPLRDKILVLHYFVRAKGTPLSHKTITYKELPDGINYFPVFHKRAIQPIVSNFGERPELLPEISSALGGYSTGYGDVAVTIDAFKRVPVTIVLWRGDKEFAPEGSLLFDSTIGDYLTNDDIHSLCENIAWTLVRLLKEKSPRPGE